MCVVQQGARQCENTTNTTVCRISGLRSQVSGLSDRHGEACHFSRIQYIRVRISRHTHMISHRRHQTLLIIHIKGTEFMHRIH